MAWWAVIVQLVIGVATVLVARAVGLRNARETAGATAQRELAARREEWWRRTQWALSAAAGDNPRLAAAGFAGLRELVDSQLATPQDQDLARAMAQQITRTLDPAPAGADTEQDTSAHDNPGRQEGGTDEPSNDH